MYFEYRSIEDLNRDIIQNLGKFPHDVDLVVGIPRSGMMPANMLALYLNKPLTDIDSFAEGRIYSSGERRATISQANTHRVLIVDDSINEGTALAKAKKKLEPLAKDYELIYAAIIATSTGAKKVDIWCEIIDENRVFQWNLFNYPQIINHACCDIDGVLCLNPPVDDDGPQYLDYITNATPYIIPTVTIDTLVSCRLEKYRTVTEQWLAKHHVSYKHLVMLPFKTKAERVAWGKHGEYKGEVYRKSGNFFFIESSLREAVDIARVSGKQVFCTEIFDMVDPGKNYKKKEQILTKIKVLIIKCLEVFGIDYHIFKRRNG